VPGTRVAASGLPPAAERRLDRLARSIGALFGAAVAPMLR
jgi:hypothetical protein